MPQAYDGRNRSPVRSQTPPRRAAPPAGGTSEGRAVGGTRTSSSRDYAEEVADLRVKLVNMTAAFHKEPAISVGDQLRPLMASLERLAADVGAFRELAGSAAANHIDLDSAATPNAPAVASSPTPRQTPATGGPAASPAAARTVTLSALSARYGLSIADLRAMNPHLADFDQDSALPRNTAVTLRARSTTPNRTTPNARQRPDQDASALVESPHPRVGASLPGPSHATPPPQPKEQPKQTAELGEDTIRIIATEQGVSVQDLIRSNPETLAQFGIDDPLPANMDLTIPEGPRVEDCVYTNPHDTLETLAIDLRVTVGAIRRMNPDLADVPQLKPLRAGTRVVVPPYRGTLAQDEEVEPPLHRRPDDDDEFDSLGDDPGYGTEDDAGPGTRGTMVVRLRVPTYAADIADDHEMSVHELLELNGHRGFGDAGPRFRFPAGTYLTVPSGPPRGARDVDDDLAPPY